MSEAAPQDQMFQIPIEVVVHQGGIRVQKVPTPEGTVTLFQIVTPIAAITLRLDDAAVEETIQSLTGGVIVPQKTGIVVP